VQVDVRQDYHGGSLGALRDSNRHIKPFLNSESQRLRGEDTSCACAMPMPPARVLPSAGRTSGSHQEHLIPYSLGCSMPSSLQPRRRNGISSSPRKRDCTRLFRQVFHAIAHEVLSYWLSSPAAVAGWRTLQPYPALYKMGMVARPHIKQLMCYELAPDG
jgi:hypothetical protein